MKTMVDNVCTLTIETILTSGLENLFSPSAVFQMSAATVSRIGAESADSVSQREELSRQCAALQSGLDIFKGQVGHGALGTEPRTKISLDKLILTSRLGLTSLKIDDGNVVPDETPNSAQTPLSSGFEA